MSKGILIPRRQGTQYGIQAGNTRMFDWPGTFKLKRKSFVLRELLPILLLKNMFSGGAGHSVIFLA